MKIKLNQNILNERGEKAKMTYKSSIEKDGNIEEVVSLEEITIGKAIENCLLYEVVDSSKMTEKEHILRYELFERIKGKEEVELNTKEIKLIKSLVVTGCKPLWAFQIIKELNK